MFILTNINREMMIIAAYMQRKLTK